MSTNQKRNDYVCRRMSVTIPSDAYPMLASELIKVHPGQGRVRRLLTLADIGATLLQHALPRKFANDAQAVEQPEDHETVRP